MRNEIRERLKKLADPERAAGARRYFKETINPLGVPVPECRRIAADLWKRRKLSKEEAFSLAEELLAGYWEEGQVGLALLEKTKKSWDLGDAEKLERLVKTRISNWAHCDDLCNHSVGYLAEKFPKEIGWMLLGWTGSENRWVRRAAAVSLILPARRGKLENLVFSIAERLVGDEDDIVRKGVGWLLKELARTREKEVINFLKAEAAKAEVRSRGDGKIPRLVLRLAAEKMSKRGKKELLAQ